MHSTAQFKQILEPIKIGNIKLKNRMVKAAYATFVRDNKNGNIAGVGDSMKGHIEAIAKGGIGLCITESCGVEFPLALSGRFRFHISRDEFISEISELPKITHKYNCPIFLQLHHAGPSFSSEGRYGAASTDWGNEGTDRSEAKLQPLAASSLSAEEAPISLRLLPREPSISEIKALIDKFGKGAERAKKAGFDGIELHFAHGYLINSFLSRVWNKRTDEYGCHDVESRARLGVKILEKVKELCGEDFPVGVRINGKEWGAENATSSSESKQFAKIFQKSGADYIHVSGYGYGFGNDIFWMFPDQALYPEPSEHVLDLVKNLRKPGPIVPYAEAIKKEIDIPVIVVDSLTPELGEWILRNNKADLIAFARRLIADPELPNKIASGKLEDIAPCTSDMGCISESYLGNPMRCRINASLGRESEYQLIPAKEKKKVMVVGGGPAGMEAARVAAQRGHQVFLYEKKKNLGGLLPLATLIKGVDSEDLPSLVRYLKTQINKLNVKVVCGEKVDLATIRKVEPDICVIATGGKRFIPNIPGINRSNVITNKKLHQKASFFLKLLGPKYLNYLTKVYLPIDKKVVIIGGQMQGCEMAEFLVKRRRIVSIVEESDQMGIGIPEVKRIRLLSWLTKKGVIFYNEVTCKKLSEKGLVLASKNGEILTIKADNFLVVMPDVPNRNLFEELKDHIPYVYMVGDCKKPSSIMDAIYDGAEIGRKI